MKTPHPKFALSASISTPALLMTAHDSSTALNDWVNFNGSKASLGGSFGVSGRPGSGLNSISFTGLLPAFNQWS